MSAEPSTFLQSIFGMADPDVSPKEAWDSWEPKIRTAWCSSESSRDLFAKDFASFVESCESYQDAAAELCNRWYTNEESARVFLARFYEIAVGTPWTPPAKTS